MRSLCILTFNLTFVAQIFYFMAQSKKNILVPTNYSEMDMIALRQSYNLARLTGARITLLNVTDHDPKDDDREKLEALAEQTAREANIEVDTLVSKGKVFEQILEVADMINAMFIIFALDRPKDINKLFGDNAFKLLRESPCPVITIRGKDHRDGCETIVLPLDHTKETREKVNKAIEIARLFNAAIKVVSVITSKDPEQKSKLLAYTQQTSRFINQKGVRCTTEALYGNDVAELVIGYAKKVDADLILIMTRQEVGLKDLFIGTAAQEIIAGSEIPVMSIRPTISRDIIVGM